MKIGALIAEFNPLHAGHKLLIDTIKRENDAVIAVMSGNFVQRGECAIFEKYDRAKAAIINGVDLAIELPVPYSLSSAEGFAKGGVETLEKCGVVNSLHFGSECGNIDALIKCAEVLNDESEEFSALLNEKLSEMSTKDILKNFNIPLTCRKKDYAPRLCDINGGFLVSIEKKLFNRHNIRLIF